MILNSPYISGSLTVTGNEVVTGSLTVLGGITGAITGSATSASYAANAELLDGLDSTVFVQTGSFNTFSSSILTYTGSTNTRLNSLEVTTGSLNTASGSAITRLNALEATTGSLNTASGSAIRRLGSIESNTGSYATTGSNTFVGQQYISCTSNPTGFTTTASLYTDGGLRVTKDAYISGTLYLNNVTVYGTQSVNYITSSQLDISDNIISVNTATPSVRFGGLAVYDSGSTSLTGSILWDSQNNNWIYSNPSGSGNYDSSMVIMGPRNSGSLGNEQGLNCNYLVLGHGSHHTTSSMIFHDGTNTCIPNTLVGSTIIGTTIYGSTTVCSTVGLFSGCVGIGTSSPTTNLEIVNPSGSVYQKLNADFGIAYMGMETADDSFRFVTAQATPIQLYTNNALRLTLDGTSGAATFTCTVTATGLTTGTTGGSTISITTSNNAGSSASPLQTKLNFLGYNGNINGQIRVDDISSTAQIGSMYLYTWNSAQVLALTLAHTGAATFSGSVTANYLSSVISSSTNASPLILQNTAGWASSQITSISVKDSSDTVGAIGWKYDGVGNVDMLFHSLYCGGYKNTSYIPMVLKGTGNVGIGTTSPNALTEIRVNTNDYGNNLILANNYPASGIATSISFSHNTQAADPDIIARISGYIDDRTSANRYGSLRFYTANAGTIYERMRINTTGNVGIGATSPAAKLHTCTAHGANNIQAIFSNSNGSINSLIYDTVVIQADDVTTLKLVERNVGSVDQVLTMTVGDNSSRISTTCANSLQFFVGGNPSACGYNGLSGINALSIASTGEATFSNNIYSDTGIFYGNKAVTISALNTDYQLFTVISGVISVRDNTNGGSGVWLMDPNGNGGAAVLIASSWVNGAYSISYTSGATYIRKTSGNIPVVVQGVVLAQ